VTLVAGVAPGREPLGVDFRILGPVEVRAQGGPVAIARGRQRALLALLLLRAGEPISRDRLIEGLWGERPPDGAVKTLQAVVSRIRRALGPEAVRLVTGSSGYQLRVEPDELDLERFERLCEEGRRALFAGRPERAAGRLRLALEEWRGPALADVALEPFAPPEIARLEELRAAAMEDRIEAELALGRGVELVGELEGLVAEDPLRERLRAQLMLALYRAGRQGAAIEAYRDAVLTLDAELGLRPGPELKRLQEAILAHDPDLLRIAPAASEAALESERRRSTATLLVTDLAGSGALRARVGEEEADVLRREHDRRLHDVLTAHGVSAISVIGDGLLASFDSAGAAVACAMEMQRAIDRQSRAGPPSLELRIGIAAGDVAWEDEDPFGTPVTEAQRLCAAAPAGGILAADVVRLLAGTRNDAVFEDAGELTLRGLVRPVRAWAVRWTAQGSVSVPVAAPLAADEGAAFAGRRDELGALRSAWTDATAGRRRGILVSGEPGIGKTRLAGELARHARERGGVVLYGHSDEGLTAPAQPFAEALGAYAAACPVDELRVQLGPRATDLLGLLPELDERLPGITEPAPAEPEAERLRTLEAAAALLEAAAEQAPVLVVLDDLHWADDLSLLMLRHVLRMDASARLMVIATYRDTEPSRSALLGEVVAGLARHPEVARLELGPLTEPEVATILEHSGRQTSLAARVRDVTHGNPFFVGEVVAAVGGDDDVGAALTPRVRDVVRARLARLPDGTGQVLDAAAIAGAQFDADVLAEAVDAELETTLAALEAAERARLIRPAGALDRFSFAHALVRQTIVEGLPAGRRARLHARIARALERAAATRTVAIDDLATHFTAAGTLVDASSALRYAREAGDNDASKLAFDIAAEQYERALQAQERLPDVTEAERLELELERGRVLKLAGDGRADEVLRAFAIAAEARGDGERMAEALLTIGLDWADLIEEDAEMVALLAQALALLPSGDSAIRARLEGFLAQQAFSSVPDDERRAMVGRALAMARRVRDPKALASALTAHSWIVAGPESLPERLALASELVAVGRDEGLPYAEVDGHHMRFLALVELGDIEEADATLAAARSAARTGRARGTAAFLVAARALLAGRLEDAEADAARAYEVQRYAASTPPAAAESMFVRTLSLIRLIQGRLGDHEDARRAMAQSVTKVPATFSVVWAHAARERDDREGARKAFERALDAGLLELPHGPTWTISLTWAAEICAWLEDRARAARLYEQLAPFADVMTYQYGPVGRPVGRLLQTLERPEEAEQLLRDAVALCERMDAQAFLAMARQDLGRLLLPSAEGRRLVDQADADAAALGMNPRV
jgi:DNA-binding SARP family transcriptional activator